MRTEFDYTVMSTYLTCPRKYNFRFNRGLVGKSAMMAADFGSAIHKGLDEWYKTGVVDLAVQVFRKEFKEDLERDNKRTHKLGEWMLRNYAEKYQDQPFKVLATEQEFTVELPNGNKLIGRIDKIIEWGGVVWVMDHKTTSMLGPTFMNMHTPNLQFSGYVYAAQQLGYTKCVGVLVDALLVAKGLLESSTRAKLTPLLRDFAYRGEADMAEYLQVVEKLQSDITLSEINDKWQPNWESCSDYGECAYRRVCKEPVELRERIIASDYRVDHWDPRDKKKGVADVVKE